MIDIEVKKDYEKYTFADLYHIIELLRTPEGCPWDREQTHESLIKPMIEEAYEAVDAIEKNSSEKMTEELGDVLLQVIFHSIIGAELGEFTFTDVTDRCARKMLFRHSHVFGDAVAKDAGAALVNWEEMKRQEKGFETLSQDLRDVPAVLPALMRAEKIAKKVRKAKNYGDASPEGADAGAICYFSEKKQDETCGGLPETPAEIGQLLYRICAHAERHGIEAELALKTFIEEGLRETEYEN